MIDRFITKKEFDDYKKSLNRRITSLGIGRRDTGGLQALPQEEEQWLSVDAVRTYRVTDFVTAANQIWESFMYVDIGPAFDMRIFAFSSFSWMCSDTNEIRFRLENQDDGTIRRTIKHSIIFDLNHNMWITTTITAFFDIVGDQTDRILLRCWKSTANGNLTIYGSATPDFCEMGAMMIGKIQL